MDLSQFLTIGGAAVLVTILVEVTKRGLALTPAQVDRWGAPLAVAYGVLGVLLLTIAQGITGLPNLAVAALTGILAGAASCGLYDLGGGGLLAMVPLAKQPGVA